MTTLTEYESCTHNARWKPYDEEARAQQPCRTEDDVEPVRLEEHRDAATLLRV
jgi:hypothetical protein